jgi:hypothetical protein
LVRNSCFMIQHRVVLTSATGYLNLIEAGYLHGDISIGNVLWKKDGQRMAPTSIQDEEICALLRDPRIGDLCTGFLIDGDMAIKVDIQNEMRTRSVRCLCQLLKM